MCVVDGNTHVFSCCATFTKYLDLCGFIGYPQEIDFPASLSPLLSIFAAAVIVILISVLVEWILLEPLLKIGTLLHVFGFLITNLSIFWGLGQAKAKSLVKASYELPAGLGLHIGS